MLCYFFIINIFFFFNSTIKIEFKKNNFFIINLLFKYLLSLENILK